MIRYARRVYDSLILALAVGAGAMLVAMFAFVVLDVGLRALGLRPIHFLSAVSEYMLLYSTMLAAPWLVRNHGHVRIDSFVGLVPGRLRAGVDLAVFAFCTVLAGLAAYFSFSLGLRHWSSGALDIRAVTIPRWYLYLPLVLGFALCAVEFSRLLVLRLSGGGQTP